MNQIEQGIIYGWEQKQAPTLFQIVEDLRAVEWLSTESSWWFAWHELDIQLPSRLPEEISQVQSQNWDVLHLFSPHVECRRIRRGAKWQWFLLAEESLPHQIADSWAALGNYSVISSRRIMWGNKIHLPAKEKPHQHGRGIVTFPRPLDYKVKDEKKNYQNALVADVQLYYDNQARLQTVRYTTLRHLKPGHKSALVDPLDEVMRHFPLINPTGENNELL